MKKDYYALWRILSILSFEFKYRTSRTIKMDTNGELGCDSSAHRTSILILTHSLEREICCCFAPVVPVFGGSEFSLRGSDCTGYSQQRFQSLEVLRFFRRFRTLKYDCYCYGSGGIYTPWSPNGHPLFSPEQ
jgi:hypothetical protein